ncbi:MAG: cyclase [Rhodospirillales bacterium 69-11]|nr:MAG: cyclase [Rhodospirillales bacterium 69-11]
MEDFRKIGQKLSNWGRWGADDRLGTLNHLTPERLKAAAQLVKTGKLFELGLAISSNGIQPPGGPRNNPVHLMSITDLDKLSPDAVYTDDYIFMPLQSVTQWDGLAHAGYDGMFYNGVPADTVTTMNGSTVLSIHQIAQKGIAGRGVLLDIAALNGVDRLARGHAIHPAELEAAEARQGVKVGPGDILLVRTGWIREFLVDKSPTSYWNGEPGLDLSCAQWLYDREVASVCSDNWGVEVRNPEIPGGLPLHSVAIRDMGMTLGEIFDLEALAQDCAADNVWEFLFTAPPLKVIGGVGTPITPLAMK